MNDETLKQMKSHGVLAVGYSLIAVLAGLITVFAKFHIRLVTSNMTTIENLEREAKKEGTAAA